MSYVTAYLCCKDEYQKKKVLQANGSKKQAGVATLMSNKIDFQPKVIKKDKEGHFIFIKGKSHKR